MQPSYQALGLCAMQDKFLQKFTGQLNQSLRKEIKFIVAKLIRNMPCLFALKQAPLKTCILNMKRNKASRLLVLVLDA